MTTAPRPSFFTPFNPKAIKPAPSPNKDCAAIALKSEPAQTGKPSSVALRKAATPAAIPQAKAAPAAPAGQPEGIKPGFTFTTFTKAKAAPAALAGQPVGLKPGFAFTTFTNR